MTRTKIQRWFKKIIVPKSNEKNSVRTSEGVSATSESAAPQTHSRNKPSVSRPGNKKEQRKKGSSPKAAATRWQLSDFKVPEQKDKVRFHDLELPSTLMHAIHDLGFEYCSPIQARSLPHSLQGIDIIGKAQTGTGKTAAFLITILDEIINSPLPKDRPLAQPRALVLAPTRELVVQIADDSTALSRYSDLHTVTMIGGAPYDKQYRDLQRRPVDILVATPGRLIDFMTRGDIYLDQLEFLVIDEADRMMDMGFIPQLKRIIRAAPKKEHRQTQLFSATFPPNIISLSQQWTFEPVQIEIATEHIAADTVDQKVYLISANQKFRVLLNLLNEPETKLALIFANRRDQTQRLYEQLTKAGVNVGILTGEVAQQKRTRTLENFKKGRYKALVATDVMGRGIHVDGITHVINFNLPDNPEDYVHRIGRTGRAEHDGVSISFACEKESFQLPAIEEFMEQKLVCEEPPRHLLRK